MFRKTDRWTTLSVLLFALIMVTGSSAFADDPLRLVFADKNPYNGTSHYYVGEDEPGFKWDIYFRDYYNDEWRMKKVRTYGDVEYYVGNRYVPSNGKRYASSASVYHSSIGDVVSFTSQNWQKEKTFTYNMIRKSDYRYVGCEYWAGMDRWDNYYMRNAWIELRSGTFGGKTRSAQAAGLAGDFEPMDNDTVLGIPADVWRTADEEILEMRLEPERFKEVMNARENENIE